MSGTSRRMPKKTAPARTVDGLLTQDTSGHRTAWSVPFRQNQLVIGYYYGLAALVVTISAASCSLALDFSETADAAIIGDPLCEAFEPNDEAASAALVTPAIPQSAALCGAGDIDLFLVTIEPFDDVDIVTMSTTTNVQVALINGTTTVDVSDAADGNETIVRSQELGNELAAGTYLIAVQASTQSTGAKEGAYMLIVTLTENEPPMQDAGVDAPVSVLP